HVTDANGCTGDDTGTLTVLANPCVAIRDTSTCQGVATRLCANQCGGTAAIVHYTWHGPGEPFPDASCIDIPASAVGTIGPLSYTVHVTDANGCAGDDTGTLTVAPGPTCTITPSDTTIAVGTTATLRGPEGDGLSYLWSTGETT